MSEALRLADIWDNYLPAYHYGQVASDTTAELRRLHAENEALRADLARYMQIADEMAQKDDTALLRRSGA